MFRKLLRRLSDWLHVRSGGTIIATRPGYNYGPLVVEIIREVERQRSIYPKMVPLDVQRLDWGEVLGNARRYKAAAVRADKLDADIVLYEEIAETWVEIQRGDRARAHEEAVQALAFLARVVVEGIDVELQGPT